MQVSINPSTPHFDLLAPIITFLDNDYRPTNPKTDDPMLISAIIANVEVKHVFIDQGSSTDILFYEGLQRMHFKDE